MKWRNFPDEKPTKQAMYIWETESGQVGKSVFAVPDSPINEIWYNKGRLRWLDESKEPYNTVPDERCNPEDMSTPQLYHVLWTKAVDTPGYNKKQWQEMGRRFFAWKPADAMDILEGALAGRPLQMDAVLDAMRKYAINELKKEFSKGVDVLFSSTLPSYEECEERREKGIATALDNFILDNEPCDTVVGDDGEARNPWREQLALVILYIFSTTQIHQIYAQGQTSIPGKE